MSTVEEDYLKMSRFTENPDAYHMLMNNYPQKDFLGLSSAEMRTLIYEPYGEDSEFKFSYVFDDVLDRIPFFVLTEQLLLIIQRDRKVKLTSKGCLTAKYCEELLQKKIIKEDTYEDKLMKRIHENYVPSIKTARIILQIAKLVELKNNTLIVSELGLEFLAGNNRMELFMVIFQTFTQDFLWAYLDGDQSELIGQLGFIFSLTMLQHYGDTSRDVCFYAHKYKKAFPLLENHIEENYYFTKDQEFVSCYNRRVFQKFFLWFGLIHVDESHIIYMDKCRYSKTDLVDTLFVTPNVLEQFL